MASEADGGIRRVLPDGQHALASTTDLLVRARSGDVQAIDLLFERSLPALRRWARARLPQSAHDADDTQDLVQEAVLHTLHRLGSFVPRHQGALQAYLRQAVANRITGEIGRVTQRPAFAAVSAVQSDSAPSPLEHVIGYKGIERYEMALQRLKPSDREAVVARIEFHQSYDEIAVALGKATPDAARTAVTRALAHLMEAMDRER